MSNNKQSDETPVWEDSQIAHQTPPLTAEQAAVWRRGHRQISPWFVVRAQVLSTTVAGLLLWLILQDSVAIISWFYGALAVWLPAAFFAMVVTAQPSMGMLVFGELVKLAFSALLILLAPVLLRHVAWLVLLPAIVLAVNMYWLAPLWAARLGSTKNN